MPLLLSAFLIGVVAGLRSATAPAAVAWSAATGHLALADSWAAFALRPLVRYAVTLAALGELVADKLPFVPRRTAWGPFAGRVASGALCGAAVGAAHGLPRAGLVLGAVGAVVGTLGGYRARAALARRFGRDLPAALLEDAVAIALAAVATLA